MRSLSSGKKARHSLTRLLAVVAFVLAVFALIVFLTGAQAVVTSPCDQLDCDLDDDGDVDAVDINVVRSGFGRQDPTPTPIPGGLACDLSFDGTTSRLTGTGWPQEYQGAEVHWRDTFGEAFGSLTVDAAGAIDATYAGNATFAGVVGLDGVPYVCVGG